MQIKNNNRLKTAPEQYILGKEKRGESERQRQRMRQVNRENENKLFHANKISKFLKSNGKMG